MSEVYHQIIALSERHLLCGYFLLLSFFLFFIIIIIRKMVYPWTLIFVLFVHCKKLKLKGFSFLFLKQESGTCFVDSIHSSHLLVSCIDLLFYEDP
jgi:hypothetical protein